MKTRITSISLSLTLMCGLFIWSTASVSAFDSSSLSGSSTDSSFDSVAAPTPGPDKLFKPYLAFSNEVTDNIYEVYGNRRKELITQVQPGFSSSYSSPIWKWDVAYNFDYVHFARNSSGDEFNNNAAIKGTITLLDQLFYLDINETYQKVDISVTHNVATESSLFINQVEQNQAIISPFLLFRLGPKTKLKIGYTLNDVRYWDSPDSINNQQHVAFAELKHEVTSKLSLTAGYTFTRLLSIASDYSQNDVYVGSRYEFSKDSFIFGKIGNRWLEFDNNVNYSLIDNTVNSNFARISNSYIFWDAGITYNFGLLQATLETSVQTAVDPLSVTSKQTSYSGKLEKIMKRGKVGFTASFSDYENSETSSGSQRVLSLASAGEYEVMPKITPNYKVAVERYYGSLLGVGSSTLLPGIGSSNLSFAYHATAAAGLSYAFNHDVTLNLGYTFETYRNDIDVPSGAVDINLVALELKKLF